MTMIPIEALQYGVLCLGFATLFYTAVLLYRELGKDRPRVDARRLIFSYMGWSLAFFALAGALQIGEKWMEGRSAAEALPNQVKTILSSMNTRLDAKFSEAIRQCDKSQVLYNTERLCNDVAELASKVDDKMPSCLCNVESPPEWCR